MKGREKHKVWLHVGMPKTGTSSVQTVMYANREVLGHHGYFYPDFGDRQQVALVRRLARRAGSKVGFPAAGRCGPHRQFRDLLDERRITAHTSILSSEYFFQRPACLPGYAPVTEEDPLEVMRRTIEETARYFDGCDVRVIMWVRRQDKWLMSLYNQTVKSSLYAEEFATFAQHTLGAQVHDIVRLWVERFGRERVVCRSYDAIAAAGANIVDAFLDEVCPDVPRGELALEDASRNHSLSAEALWLKRGINRFLAESGRAPGRPLRRRIARLLREGTAPAKRGSGQLLSNGERQQLMLRYLQGNQRLVTELGYAELAPMVNLDDLARPAPAEVVDGDALAATLRQMIQTLSRAAPGKRVRGPLVTGVTQ